MRIGLLMYSEEVDGSVGSMYAMDLHTCSINKWSDYDCLYYRNINSRHLEQFFESHIVSGRRAGLHALPSFILDNSKKTRIRPLTSWSIPDNDFVATSDALTEIFQSQERAGFKIAFSAGTLAIQAMNRYLPLRYYQGLRNCYGQALSAVHIGPMFVAHSYAPMATMIDVNGAFLHALAKPLPRWNEQLFELDEPILTEDVADFDGILSAVWNVPYCYGYGSTNWLPPLPSKYKGNTVWGYGSVYSTCTGDMARQAVAQGCTIQRTMRAAVSVGGLDTHMLPLYDAMCELKEWCKPLSKNIYTRVFGCLASVGGFAYSCKSEGEVMFHDSNLKWHDMRRQDGDNSQVTFRPDIAAYISGKNCVNVVSEAARYGDRLLGGHVDALMIGGGVDAPEGWSVKGRGEWKGYGIGNYIIGEHVASAGRREDITLEQHFSMVADTNNVYRQWNGNSSQWNMNRVGFPVLNPPFETNYSAMEVESEQTITETTTEKVCVRCLK